MSLSTTRVSIAMCTFNGSSYLDQQLESIAAQTLQPAELVICDDNSTDGTWEMLLAFQRRAPFEVHVFANKERLGPTRNFEKAIGLCKGEFISLADQDDIWCPTKLEVLVRHLVQQPSAIYSFSDGELIDEIDNSLGISLWNVVGFSANLWTEKSYSGAFHQLLKANAVTGCAMVFRGSFKELILPIPTTWIHDYWIAILGSAVGFGVPIPEQLIKYRRHAAQAVGVHQITIKTRYTKSRQSGKMDYLKRLEGIQSLRDRLENISGKYFVRPELKLEVNEKVDHFAARVSSQEAKGIERLWLVLRESASGRYGRFSGSWRSALRDLFPPAQAH